ncbi:Cytochrome P450 family protein [Nostocoides australiense Ben110]|uniref:Cytochrome P450 family protein n=1 Tax=Nostocoides australiense Ben110 TaxID=1193182 RepID=W6JWT5_9MICO|nr:cytochrome P450 [Tetrasphaera australiensis]CCH73221.1 Cytochrome P450 family protein [Tetrasphaera australiensis Ben110]
MCADILDFADPAFLDDPYPAFDRQREAAPFAWHEGLQAFVATSHQHVSAVLRDRRLGRIFRPREPEGEWETFNWLHADSILDSEPPKHTRLRRLVAGAFGRGHVQRLAPRVEELATQLLDAATDGTAPFDVIKSYAEPLPVLVIAELLGFPDIDRHLLRPWSQAIVKMYEVDRTPLQENQAREACRDFAAYVSDLAAHRINHPGEDLLTDLVQIRDGSDKLSERELIATAVLLLNAGHEASVNGMGNGLHSWLAAGKPGPVDPDRPAAVEALVEEFLRHDSPLQLFERTATDDLEIAGVPIAKGHKAIALLGAANRDPEVFTDPHTFAPARTPNNHLAFGLGIHFCIGAPLARLELHISTRLLLTRYPELALVDAVRRPTFVLRGFESLIVAPGPTGSGG